MKLDEKQKEMLIKILDREEQSIQKVLDSWVKRGDSGDVGMCLEHMVVPFETLRMKLEEIHELRK